MPAGASLRLSEQANLRSTGQLVNTLSQLPWPRLKPAVVHILRGVRPFQRLQIPAGNQPKLVIPPRIPASLPIPQPGRTGQALLKSDEASGGPTIRQLQATGAQALLTAYQACAPVSHARCSPMQGPKLPSLHPAGNVSQHMVPRNDEGVGRIL